MGEVAVDPAFIQAVEHRPNLTIIQAEGIPIIDLSSLINSSSSSDDSPKSDELERLISEIGKACSDWGFFQVINHGVPLECRQRIESVSRKFFALSKEEKLKVKRDEENPLGYYDTEHTKNVRDWKEVFDFTVQNPAVIPASDEPEDEDVRKINSQWPQYPPEFR